MKSYKVELDLNNKQRTACYQHAGAARWAYNWGLRQKIEAYDAWIKSGKQGKCKTPTAIDLHRDLNKLKRLPKEDGGCPWMYDSSKCAPQEALRHLDDAFQNFYRRCREGQSQKGFPKFKSRHRGIGGFTLTGPMQATPSIIKLPRLGIIRLKEQGYIPQDERIIAATVSEKAGRWFVSVRTDAEPSRVLGSEILGVDVGSRKLAVLSDGTIFENPRALRSSEERLRLLQKSVSRKVKGSNNRKKAVHRLARQHYRVSCIRKDAIHKATDAIAKRSMTVILESLNVRGMMKNHRLSKSLADASMSEFHRCLKYKMAWSGGQVIEVPRFFPSSKTCSCCGHIKEDLGFNETYECVLCGLTMDRDFNAAINLRVLAESSSVIACGPEKKSDAGTKQEPDFI